MINQWEFVKQLKCPIPTLPSVPDFDFNSTSTPSYGYSAVDADFNEMVHDATNPMRPIYCIKDGPEILDDLKIRPVEKTMNCFFI